MVRIGKTILVLFAATALALPALALQNPSPPKRTGEQKKFRDADSGRKGGGHGRGRKGWQRRPGRHGGDWLRKMHNLPPEEQERALQNDPEFQRLPAEAQARLRERLRKFNSLPPEQRERILNNWERVERLTPEQQAGLRRLHGRMREMPEARRRMMFRALRHLRDMPSDERQRVLASERFRNTFSDEERDLLRGMAEIGPPPEAPPPDSPQKDEPPPPEADAPK